MRADTQALKERFDLRDIVEQDLGPASMRGGRAHLWRCPFHHEKRGYSLAVWADGYRCFGRCNTGGDVLDWLQKYRHLCFVDALHVLDHPTGERRDIERRVSAVVAAPPLRWQKAAAEVVTITEKTLWSPIGRNARAYLEGRGLTTDTIRRARIGYVPGNWRSRKRIAGLAVPCGITIPWFAGGVLWAVKVRRACGIPKYGQIAGGSTAGLFGADQLVGARIAMFCEGEFDALLAHQEAGSIVSVVTLGSAVNALSAYWHDLLLSCQLVLVAYDHDQAGERGAQLLSTTSARFRTIQLPSGNDISDFHVHGGDICRWVEHELNCILTETGVTS